MENNKTKSLCFQVSIFISVWLFLILLITNVLFVFHISIGIYNTIIALISTVVFCQLLYKDTRSVVKITVVSLIVVAICIAIAGQWIDCSWDGSTYHKFATGALKDGWNPIYESILSFSQNNTYQLVNERVMTWSEAYPKASWYIAANIYCITGNIECGKAYTLLFMAILFGCVYEYAKAKNIVWWKCGLIAFVSILNPVCLAQMVSYYLDGMAACVLIILIISLLSMAKDEIKENWEYAILAFTMIAFGCNLKFSITFFVAISCLTYFVYMAVIKKGKQLVTTFVYFAISVIVAFLGVGCTTYLTNLVRENGLENNVEFLGYTLELNKYYNISDCLVACSFREGLPLNVIEAMLCGDAVVASNNRGHRELVENGATGFILDATDAEGFADKIIKVLENTSVYAKAALEKAELFTDKNVVEELKKIYFD